MKQRVISASLALLLAGLCMADNANLAGTAPLGAEVDARGAPGQQRLPVTFSYLTQNWGLDLSTRYSRQSADSAGMWYAPPTLRMLDGRLSRAGAPFLLRAAPLAGGRPPSYGWEDMTLAASRYWALGSEEDAYTLDLRASVKLPTGSRLAGFSSGKSDWGMSTAIGKGYGDFSASLNTGYTFIGRPDGMPGGDVWSADLYLGYVATDTTSFGLDYAWSQQPYAFGPPARALGLSASFKMGKLWRLTFNAAHGYSALEPQRDLNATFSYRFD